MHVHRLVSKAKSGLKGSLSAALWVVAGFASAQMSTPGQFGVSPSGAATYSIPIQVPPGVAGMQPKLSLEYNSQSGNGILGMGWNLSGLSAITRCPKTLATDGERGSVKFNIHDRFCLDGQRLVLKSGAYGIAGSEYRTEIDSFSKITAVGSVGDSGDGPVSFLVQTKAGVTMEYGGTADSRIEAIKAPGSNATWSPNVVRVWALNKVTDAVGNEMTMSYEEDIANGSFYLQQVNYAGHSVELEYGSRQDQTQGYDNSSFSRMSKLLLKVNVKVSGVTVREYRLAYAANATALHASRIVSIQECVNAPQTCMPAISFESQQSNPWAGDFNPATSFNLNNQLLQHSNRTVGLQLGDFNGDGKTDILRYWNNNFTENAVFLSNGDGSFTRSPNFNIVDQYLQSDGGSVGVVLADFNGDGRTDILRYWNTFADNALFLSNGDGSFTKSTNFNLTTQLLQHSNGTVGIQLGDFNGDGKTDILRYWNNNFTENAVFLSNGDGSFTRSTLFNLTNDYLQSDGGTVKVVVGDFNGDGKADILRSWNNTFTKNALFLSNGDGSFAQAPGFNITNEYLQSDGGTIKIQLGDFLGEGRMAILRHDDVYGNNKLFIPSLQGVSSAVTGLSGHLVRTEIGYTLLTKAASYTPDSLAVYPRTNLQIPLQVVSSVASSNGIGGTNTVSYQYGGLKAENASTAHPGSGRGMLGFRWMKSTEQATGIESYTEFSQSWPTIGAAIKSETRHPSAAYAGLLKRTSTTYQATTGSAANTTFVYPGSVIEESWDFNGAPLPTIQTYYEYAPSAYEGNNTVQYGDPSRIVVNTRYGGADAGRKTTVNTYAAAVTTGSGTGSWVLGRLKRASVTSENAPGSFSGFAAPPPPPPPAAIVIPPPVVVLPASASVYNYYCSGSQGFTANAVVSGGRAPMTYAWTNSSPSIVAMSAGNAASAVFGANGNGQSSVRVTVTDADGRVATSNYLTVSSSVADYCWYGY